MQRSSPPSTLDRLLAVSFGVKAVDAIAQSQPPYQYMVAWEGGQTQLKPLAQVMARIKAEKAAHQRPCAFPVDPQGGMVHTARSLGICLGD
jgi:ATP-dependent phosphofructokinase / diphosphate-dependent phosphofructokinase